jgi:hypothetical protein
MTVVRTHFNRRTTLVATAFIAIAGGTAAADCPASRGARTAVIGATYVVGELGALAIRHNDWWHPPARSFHFEWGGSPSKGQDALLHASISYQASQVADIAWRWACVREPTAAWLAAATAFAVGLPKELGDGLHQNGFSGTDMMWTAIGALVPALHRTWAPSRVARLKVFYWPSDEYRNKVGQFPQLENDYAGQRYYLAINPARAGGTTWPAWLGFALGHSVPTWASLPPTHEWFATLDVDLGGLPIKARWWKNVTAVVDQVHIPLPGFRRSGGKTTVGVY